MRANSDSLCFYSQFDQLALQFCSSTAGTENAPNMLVSDFVNFLRNVNTQQVRMGPGLVGV